MTSKATNGNGDGTMTKRRAISKSMARLIACLSCLIAIAGFSTTAAQAASGNFCVGNRGSHKSCEGPQVEGVRWANNRSTNGGWSWVWVWNGVYGGNASSCESGNCEAWAELGGSAPHALGKEQMENIAGGTYYFVAQWGTV
jgi:hypothetical protein